MRGFIIAAGTGSRMGQLTEARPKCLLPIAGRTLLEHTIERLRAAGCSEIVIIVGYKAEMVNVPNVRYVANADYATNNILHSLMKARDYLSGPVIVTYSDIWVEPWIYERLMETPGDIVLAVDQDWRPYYEERSEHPLSDAEKVYFRQDGSVTRLGKHLDPDGARESTCGEFLGLWSMTAAGADRFCQEFAAVDARMSGDDPFQQANNWTKAYVTDMIQEIVNRGHTVRCALIERGWAELDTQQDYARLMNIAERQRLTTISGGRQRS